MVLAPFRYHWRTSMTRSTLRGGARIPLVQSGEVALWSITSERSSLSVVVSLLSRVRQWYQFRQKLFSKMGEIRLFMLKEH